ncbi:MAG TPA: hypothetical protein VGD67_23000 [Pseudonocardiaceae bacterium]
MDAEPVRTSIARRLLDELGVGEAENGDRARATTRLCSSPEFAGRVVVIPAWEERDPSAVAAYFTAVADMVRDLPPADRPRTLVVARLRDVPQGMPDRIDTTSGTAHWWWGCTTSADTSVVVAMTRSAQHSPDVPEHLRSVQELVAVDVAASVAGPDLDLARHLAAGWDGRVSSLPDLVDGYVEARPPAPEIVWGGPGRHWSSPPGQLRTGWAQGLVDRWDGQVMVALAAFPADCRRQELSRRIWRGQHRALNPLIDMYRSILEQIVHRRSSTRVIELIAADGRTGRPERPGAGGLPMLELNQMRKAVRDLGLRLDPQEKRLLTAGCAVRNSLAHHDPVTDDEIRELLAAAHAMGVA